jgi:hypothetical protein
MSEKVKVGMHSFLVEMVRRLSRTMEVEWARDRL